MAPPDDTTTVEEKDDIKLGVPEEFKGTNSEGDRFIRDCELYFLGKATKFTDDIKKVLFALSYMKGFRVEPFKDKLMTRLQDAGATATTWEIFKTEFDKAFMFHDKPQRALNRLSDMKQNASQGIESFLLTFEAIAGQTDLDDTAKVMMLKAALNANVVQRIYNQNPIPSSSDLMHG